MGHPGSLIFLFPGGDLDHSQNIMGSKLDQDARFYLFDEDLTSSICVILQTNEQTDKQMVMNRISP